MRKFDVLLTGGTGALGSHVILRLRELEKSFFCLDLRSNPVPEKFEIDHVIHLAGVNRGSDLEVEQGNVLLAHSLIDYLRTSGMRPQVLTYSNSIKASDGTSSYAHGKRKAEEILRDWCSSMGVQFRTLMLPNLIGEFGRPAQNMISSTIAYNLVNEIPLPEMSEEEFQLATLNQAAEVVIDQALTEESLDIFKSSAKNLASVGKQIYFSMLGQVDTIPDHQAGQKLWSMLVDERFRKLQVMTLAGKSDERGTFTELFKARAPEQQLSFLEFTSGATRGNHFHRHLVEDFYVADGSLEVFFGRAWIAKPDQNRVFLNKGQTIRFPIGWWHAFRDQTDRGSKVIVRAQKIFNSGKPDTIRGAWY